MFDLYNISHISGFQLPVKARQHPASEAANKFEK
jgi:hypothetical protein